MARLWNSYKLRVRRRRLVYRAARKSRDLTAVVNRTDQIRPGDVLAFVTARNELVRWPFFLKYYRDLGIRQFLVVDNGSTDGSRDYLSRQDDVSLWETQASYRQSRFGMDWLTWLLNKYGADHWCLTVDPDEFFSYPFCDTRPIDALTDWLDAGGVKSFGTMLLDMYPKGPIGAHPYVAGANPMDIAHWFDAGNYSIRKNQRYGNLWIQGGPRARMFFRDAPRKAPALNKIPLVHWKKGYVYTSSTHAMLPRGLNRVFDEWGGEIASGVLMHTKFLATFAQKTTEEMQRGEHFDQSGEYRAYDQQDLAALDLWCPWSEKYINWRQLEILGLMSKGNWA